MMITLPVPILLYMSDAVRSVIARAPVEPRPRVNKEFEDVDCIRRELV